VLLDVVRLELGYPPDFLFIPGGVEKGLGRPACVRFWSPYLRFFLSYFFLPPLSSSFRLNVVVMFSVLDAFGPLIKMNRMNLCMFISFWCERVISSAGTINEVDCLDYLARMTIKSIEK